MKNYISSFRDLPVVVYQFQNKLRNELRAKSGVMRGREFLMKDMYSFSLGEEDHTKFYNQTIEAYKRIFDRVEIGKDTYVTFASGGAFTQFSHEFQTICEAGEDTIYVNREKGIALNEEVLNDDTLKTLDVSRGDLQPVASAEVGNIFNFGIQKSEDLGLAYKNDKGEEIPVWMGSYGIGISRLMGLLVEKFADDKGIVWPKAVAPFQVHVVELGADKNATVHERALELVAQLEAAGVEVLLDDREASAGEKFADSDLLGMPYRVVISEKNMSSDQLEIKDRQSGETLSLRVSELIAKAK
jgi:prolyl-tRNA synthetase